MLPAEALIFDMDGLLLDTEALYFRATQQMVEPYGHTVDLQQYGEWIGRSVSYAEFQSHYPMPVPEDEWRTLWRETFRQLCDTELALRPGAREFLDTTAAAYPKALASSTRPEGIERLMQQACLADYFPVRVSGKEVARGKPAPDIWLEAARRLGVDPARCVVFEDSPHGIRGAKEAGMRAVAVPTEHTAQLDFSLADLLVERLTDVTPEWLRGELAEPESGGQHVPAP